MSNHEGNPRDRLVHLQLIDLFNITPAPDKSVQGPLAKMLKSVGSKGKHAVRARMITAVSNTKFETLDGEPISLVGLHGKGEMLAVGPTWAIERLAEGETPEFDQEVSALQGELEEYRRLVALVRANADESHVDLSQIPDDINKLRSGVIAARRRSVTDVPTDVPKTKVLSILDDVIVKLESFITDCESGEFPWWFFWSTTSDAKRKEVGLPIEGESIRSCLLAQLDLTESARREIRRLNESDETRANSNV